MRHQLPWFLLLGTLLLAKRLPRRRQLITWGNSSCWQDGDWRVYELCCFPIPNTFAGQVEVEEEGFPGFSVGRRSSTGVFPSCWLGKNFNESDCCRPKGSFFKMDVRSLPPPVAHLFNGCQAASWQSFLFKLRITGGVMWAVNARILNWFYDFDFGKRKARQSFQHWSIPTRKCPIGYALMQILEHYLTFLTLDNLLPSEPFEVLEKAEAELKPFGGLFAAVGISWHQLQYIRLLYSLQNRHFSGEPQRPLAAAPAVEWHEGATGLDLGASQGVDAEMMLRQGLQVLAVEGNAVALQYFRERMAKETSPIASALTMVHAATGGSSVPALVEFQVDDHHAEKSFIFDARKDTPLVDATMTRVPQKSCGALYRQFVKHSAVYVKIDLEGTDLECLGSLLRNGTSGWELPRFVSIEVPPSGDVILDGMSKRWENELLGSISGSYCHAKLCRQHLYNLRWIPGLDLVSRYGWGASGPFGDHAVDWRRGESWAPVGQVLNEVLAASIIARMSHEWFDLHLRRC